MPQRVQKATVVPMPGLPPPPEASDIVSALRQCVIEISGVLQKLSVGGLADGEKAGHLDAETHTFTSAVRTSDEFKVYHSLGRRPRGRWVVGQDFDGVLYDIKHKWTPEYVVFMSSRASQEYTVILF